MISLNNLKSLRSLFFLKKLVLAILILQVISFVTTVSFIALTASIFSRTSIYGPHPDPASVFLGALLIPLLTFLTVNFILFVLLIIVVVEIHRHDQTYKEKLDNLFILWLVGTFLFPLFSGFTFIYLIVIVGFSYSRISKMISNFKVEEEF